MKEINQKKEIHYLTEEEEKSLKQVFMKPVYFPHKELGPDGKWRAYTYINVCFQRFKALINDESDVVYLQVWFTNSCNAGKSIGKYIDVAENIYLDGVIERGIQGENVGKFNDIIYKPKNCDTSVTLRKHSLTELLIF